jgi:hypothetical protein
MLSERNLQLLTAFVDGELTRRERKLVMRLLNRSSQARSVLQELQEGAHRVRELPRRQLRESFANQVLQAIADQGLRVDSRHATARRPRRWFAYAAAACVLLAISLGVYLANRTGPDTNANVVAKVNPAPEFKAPLRVTFKELAEQGKQELLAHRLQAEPAIHLDITVRNNATAVGDVRQALEAQGIKTIVDTAARVNLDKGAQRKVTYFIYAENVEAKELETMLKNLGGGSKKQPAQSSNFESVVVTAISPEDRHDLSALFGAKPADFATSTEQGDPFGNTIIAAPKDKKGVTPPRQAERFAMILASADGASPSDEAKAFIAGRVEQRPGTMRVLLVIRQA